MGNLGENVAGIVFRTIFQHIIDHIEAEYLPETILQVNKVVDGFGTEIKDDFAKTSHRYGIKYAASELAEWCCEPEKFTFRKK
jgi:hypothetical protein